MPERRGTQLAVLGAATFAVADNGGDGTSPGQPAFELLDLSSRHKVVLCAGKDQHIARNALRDILKRVNAERLDRIDWIMGAHHQGGREKLRDAGRDSCPCSFRPERFSNGADVSAGIRPEWQRSAFPIQP